MKKFIIPICFALTLAACSTKKDKTDTTRQIVLTDTSNLQPASTTTDVGVPVAAPAPVAAPKPTIVYVDRYVTPAPKKTITRKPKPVTQDPTPDPVVNNTPPAPSTTTGNGTGTANTPPVVEKKRGISTEAKGAIIGGVGGAVAGAVIGRNAKGAIIGGAVGAAGGYILGRQKARRAADSTRNY